MNSNLESNLVVSNRKFIDNDTSEIVDKYIDEICSNSDFLCNNIDLCGNNTSIYANVENVRNICDNIKEANICENYNIRFIKMPDNGRMASGFKAIYENAKNDIIVFLENDFVNYSSKQEALDFLNK